MSELLHQVVILFPELFSFSYEEFGMAFLTLYFTFTEPQFTIKIKINFVALFSNMETMKSGQRSLLIALGYFFSDELLAFSPSFSTSAASELSDKGPVCWFLDN